MAYDYNRTSSYKQAKAFIPTGAYIPSTTVAQVDAAVKASCDVADGVTDGLIQNPRMTNYIIPTPLDTPPLDVVLLENPYPHGPFGAKGVGEMPIDGPAPAVVNAPRHAGFDIREIPATPERLMR